MATQPPTTGHTAPRQERSRATRDRILAALARLLEGKTFDRVSVAEITAAARCSTSSFYARFPTKAALFDAFLERFFEVSSGMAGGAFSKIAESDAEDGNRERLLIEFLLQSYRDHRGLLRSLILHGRSHPDSGFGNRTRDRKRQAAAAAVRLVLGKETTAIDPRALASASFAYWLVVQAIEQIVLFDDPLMGREHMAEPQLVEELTAVLRRALEPPVSA